MAEGVSEETVRSLEAAAREVRREVLESSRTRGSGHPGESLSVADLVTALVFRELRLDPAKPDWPEHDRLLLANRRAAPALRAALALRGFPAGEEFLASGPPEGRLPGGGGTEDPFRPAGAFPGSPGLGLGVGVGLALAARMGRHPYRTYAILGEGECRAGPTWEALMAGGHYRLSNLVVLVTRSGSETGGATNLVVGIDPITDKLRDFRYHVLEVDGHDHRAILGAFNEARHTLDRPTAVVARTVRGRGVSFLEEKHGDPDRSPTTPELEQALAELGTPPGERP